MNELLYVREVPDSPSHGVPGNHLTYFIVPSLILFHHSKNIFHSINFTPTYATFSSSVKLSVSVSVTVSFSLSLSVSLSLHILLPRLSVFSCFSLSGDLGVVSTVCSPQLLQYVTKYVSAAQWLYLARLPAPHDNNEWSSWFLTRLVKDKGW